MRRYFFASLVAMLTGISGTVLAAGLTIHNESGHLACIATSSADTAQTTGWYRIEPGSSQKLTGVTHVYAMQCDNPMEQWVLPERFMPIVLCVNLSQDFQYPVLADYEKCRELGGTTRLFYECLDVEYYHWTLD